MNAEGFPRKAWKLMPSFKPVEIELVSIEKFLGEERFASTSTGGFIALDQTWPTREAAISAGWERIAVIEADLEKRQVNLKKRMAALKKAQRA